MFDEVKFEQKVYDFVTREVNQAFSASIEGMAQQTRFRMQRQIMRALNAITEETITQISYGLLLNKPPVQIFRYGAHLFEEITLDEATALFVCKQCKKTFLHDYRKQGDKFSCSASKINKNFCGSPAAGA